MASEVVLRKWGNSLGVVLPKELVENKGLHEKEVILIEVVKEANLKDVFGSLKRKMSGQEFKDLVKQGWE